MTEFRPKLAAILLLSEANIRKGCPYLAIDVVGSPNDVVEIENPMTIDDTPAKLPSVDRVKKKPHPLDWMTACYLKANLRKICQ